MYILTFIIPVIFIAFYIISMVLISTLKIPPMIDPLFLIAAIFQIFISLYMLSVVAFKSVLYFITIYMSFDTLKIKNSFYFFYCLECLDYKFRSNSEVDQETYELSEDTDILISKIEESRISGKKMDFFIFTA
jgi:hypothetical protein